MVDFFRVLPFSIPGHETQVDMDPRLDSIALASAGQLIQFLKLLNVEQKSIAAFLDVPVSAVSMWVRGHRDVPVKYREVLLVYVECVMEQALKRMQKEVEILPKAQQEDTLVQYVTSLKGWHLDVLHTKGFLQRTMQAECRWIGSYAKYDSFPADDRRRLIVLCKTLITQLETMEELEARAQRYVEESDSETPAQT